MGTHLGSLLEGHGARDGAVAKALLLQLHLEPLNGGGKLAEDQRLGRGLPLPHHPQLHQHSCIARLRCQVIQVHYDPCMSNNIRVFGFTCVWVYMCL